MLTELTLHNLGVITAATLTPGPGLTVVTGETGAGKTLVVTGLSLLAGGRFEPGYVRRDADRARVEGRFAPVSDAVVARVDELGGALDDGELILARQATTGRSRAWVGGASVPQAAAVEIGAELVTIHGQSEQIRLGSSERQREVLDRAGGVEAERALAEYRAAYVARRRVVAEHRTVHIVIAV